MISPDKTDVELRNQSVRGYCHPVDDPLGWAEAALRYIADERGRNPRYTQKAAAQQLGIAYTTLAHGLRMVNRLRETAREALRAGLLTLGHGKALAAFAGIEQDEMVARLVRCGASVRAAEEAAAGRSGRQPMTSRGSCEPDVDLMYLEERISAVTGGPVSIEYAQDKQRGRVVLAFADHQGLETVLGCLGVTLAGTETGPGGRPGPR
ncbi:hypothetical protein [uncultured Thiodictyon sp.]|uniref:hypothetical protein n=1 Tax=uncultured Thiodictyon sp. TaxID=1846217 RepID=UPI0025FD6A44|nr:hypothetical protein [uncultured Thiodictyon sp.]